MILNMQNKDQIYGHVHGWVPSHGWVSDMKGQQFQWIINGTCSCEHLAKGIS